MNAAFRCRARDEFGHVCNQKRGHEKHNDYHSAFGRHWPTVDPMKVKRTHRVKK